MHVFSFFRFRSNLFNFVTLSTDESVSKLHYADVSKFHFEYRFVYLTTGDNFYPSDCVLTEISRGESRFLLLDNCFSSFLNLHFLLLNLLPV